MARQQYYPGADRNAQNFYAQYPALFAPSRRMADVNTLVLHTTEGGSWPGYSNGTMTPTFTYDPRSHQMRQHIPVDMAARALVDAGIGTNRLNVAQIEIIGYAAQGGPLDAQAIADLGALVAWLNAEWSLPITAPYPFAVPAHRMSAAEYIACRGVIGHEHVYGNTHWDPGAMNVPAILAAASRTAGPGGIAAGTVHIPGAPTFPTDMPASPTQEETMLPIFMASVKEIDPATGKEYTGAPVYALSPGAPLHHVTPQEWALWARLGAVMPTDRFLRAEIDMTWAQMQPATSVAGTLPIVVAVTDADRTAIAKAVRAEIIREA